MDSRQQFEEWYMEGAYGMRKYDRFSEIGLSEDGAFEIWHASRESLVIELPEPIELETVGVGCTMSDEYFDIDDVKLAIHAAGIRTK